MPDTRHDCVIFFLSPEPVRAQAIEWGSYEHQRFTCFKDSVATASSRTTVYVIDGKDPSYTHETLQQLRSHSDHYADLCYIYDSIDPIDHRLSDGELPNQKVLDNKIAEMQQLDLLFKTIQDGLQTHEQWLMRFLLMRPDYVITPLHDWSHIRRYRYPILEVLRSEERL